MLQLFLAMAVIAGTISLSIFRIDANVNKQVQIHQEAKKLIDVDKKRVFANRFTKSPISRRGSVRDIKLSEIAVMPTTHDAMLLNKLQKATEEAIINEHIDSPNCTQLAATGFISFGECNEIKDKHQNYMEFKDNSIQLSNKTQNQKIFRNMVHVQGNLMSSEEQSDSQISITRPATFIEANRQANEQSKKTLVIASQLIKKTDSPSVTKTILEKVVKQTISNPIETQKFLKDTNNIITIKIANTPSSGATNIQQYQNIQDALDGTDTDIKNYTDTIKKITSKSITDDKVKLTDADKNTIRAIKDNIGSINFNF